MPPKRKAVDAAESDAKAVKVTTGDEELGGPVATAAAPAPASAKGKGKSAPKAVAAAGAAIKATTPKAVAGKGKAAPAAAAPAGAAPAAAAGAAASAGPAGAGVDVHITSSKACQAFKTRVTQLEAAIKAARPGVTIEVNEEKKLGTKPDRGTFAVTVRGTKLVELVAMPRPFTAMKALDIGDLGKQVIAALEKK